MNKKLVSIVVPIYNVEEYLRECIDSICTQTYENIEIILVDDGSTDTSPEICDTYQKIDSRIRAFHKNNGGLSDARNYGLNVATGEYIAFIDSDDYIDESFVKNLLQAAEENDADIAVCSYRKVYDKPIQKYGNINYIAETVSGISFLKSLYSGKHSDMGFVAWNKLYKKKLFTDHEIIYPKGRIYEDTFTTYKLLYYTKKVALIDYAYYSYRIRPGSIMQSSMTVKKCKDWLEGDQSAVDFFWREKNQELFDAAFNSFLRSQIVIYKKLKKAGISDGAKYILEGYTGCYNKNISNSSLKFPKKNVYSLFRFAPDMISLLY